MTPHEIATFETWSLNIGVSGLILYMIYIVYKLAQESKAGKFGMFVLFFALGLGIFGFVAKSIVYEMLAQ